MTFSRTRRSSPLADRVTRARTEGRTQQALELAKQLAKNEPCDEHLALVRDVSFERGCQLLKDGKPRDAITLFMSSLQGETPIWFRAQTAEKLAEAGDVAAALEVFATMPDSAERTKAFTRAVDAAVVGNAKAALPPDMHPGFDAVRTAFNLVEKGQDDAAREALHAIGLSSPYLEWKVMIRGLIAYHQNDDVRAQDNWQRLDANRQPWRLIAPFRFQIDRVFREAQPPAVQERLRVLVSRLAGNHLVAALRGLGPAFGPWKEERHAKAGVRAVIDFVRLHGAAHPSLVPQLGQLLAVKIINEGSPDEIESFRRYFKSPDVDPKLNRMTALLGESVKNPNYCIDAWLAYEKDIAAMPERFPGDTGRLARALILEQIARTIEKFEPDSIPRRLPSLEECCRRSAEMVPTRVEPHVLLVKELRRHPKKKREALTAAKELVQKFPDHAPTWEFLADSSYFAKQYPSAVEAMRNILRIDPLRPNARQKLATALWKQAFKAIKARAPKPEKYRPLFEESLRLDDTSLIGKLLTWSMIESTLGHTEEATRLNQLVRERPQSRLAVPLAHHVACLTSKATPKDLKDLAKTGWVEALRQPPTFDEAISALETLEFLDGSKVTGKATLIKSLLPNLKDRTLEPLGLEKLLRLGRLLIELDYKPGVKVVTRNAAARFPTDPAVCLLEIDAVLAAVGIGSVFQNLRNLNDQLERARRFAEALPREAKERILVEIQQRQEAVGELEKRHGLDNMPIMEQFFGQMLDRFLDSEDDDEPFF